MKVYDEIEKATKSAILTIAGVDTSEPFNDQYRNTDNDDPKNYPAVYFELLEPIEWKQDGNFFQRATVRTRLHLVCFTLANNKDKLHTLAQDVFVAFNGKLLYDSANIHLTSEWTRVASSIPTRYRQLKVMTIDFEYELYDRSAMPVYGTGGIDFVLPQ